MLDVEEERAVKRNSSISRLASLFFSLASASPALYALKYSAAAGSDARFPPCMEALANLEKSWRCSSAFSCVPCPKGLLSVKTRRLAAADKGKWPITACFLLFLRSPWRTSC